MKILVTGSRNWTDESSIRAALQIFHAEVPTIIHGCASGADLMAERIAIDLGYPVKGYPARWWSEGRAAGPKRNQRMLDCEMPIDQVLAFPLAESVGTWDMIRRAQKMGIPVMICAATASPSVPIPAPTMPLGDGAGAKCAAG